MMKSLDNQDRIIQEFSQGLRVRLDDLDSRQEGFVQQIVEILSSNATSLVRPNGNKRRQSLLETDLVDAMNKCSQPMEEDVAKIQMSPSRLARVRAQFVNIFRYDSMFDREIGVAEAHSDTLRWICIQRPQQPDHKVGQFQSLARIAGTALLDHRENGIRQVDAHEVHLRGAPAKSSSQQRATLCSISPSMG